MRSKEAIRDRIARLEREYDQHDPPSSPAEEELEVALLRAIEELEWVLGDREEDDITT